MLSIGISSAHRGKYGHCEDLQIEEQRPIFDIVDIIFHSSFHLCHGLCFTAEAAHLRPPGYAGLHSMTCEVAANELRILLIVIACMRPGPNQRHGPAKNIEKLR